MAHRKTPRYVKPGPEISDGSYGVPAHDTDQSADLIITETILFPRLASQLCRRQPVFVVAHVHESAGEENQDTEDQHGTPTKRPVRHKTGGFKFKQGS